MLAPTYTGFVDTSEDALLIFEACRLGILKCRNRRLAESERKHIKSGWIFIWDETESHIKRWTDGKRWSPSRVNGCFLIYTELQPKSSPMPDVPLENGLTKKSLSIFTSSNTKLHLVSYYRDTDVDNGKLLSPSNNPMFSGITVAHDRYPDIPPEMVHAPVRATQTVSTRRASMVSMISNDSASIHECPSLQQTFKSTYIDSQQAQMANYQISAVHPMPVRYYEPQHTMNPIIAHPPAAAAVATPMSISVRPMPPHPEPSPHSSYVFQYLTTSDYRDELRSQQLHNLSQSTPSAHMPSSRLQPHQLPLPPPPPPQSFRRLSLPYALDNSNLVPNMGRSMSSSRRNTVVNMDRNVRLQSEQSIDEGNVKLPPISELMSGVDVSAARSHVSLDSGASVAEKTKMKYRGNPWERRPSNASSAYSLESYSIS
ncbi:Gluconate transport-inducing protein [Kickxella alabastrina]|uniref:Gluconate transport-inducing protein n=1 Tax=Kickxella alabastrina TaxID=61397 RepID=A0ACC1IV22_9FUNG|nr:Gluconate transport-inducing protein [Kickxella alabastrina]